MGLLPTGAGANETAGARQGTQPTAVLLISSMTSFVVVADAVAVAVPRPVSHAGLLVASSYAMAVKFNVPESTNVENSKVPNWLDVDGRPFEFGPICIEPLSAPLTFITMTWIVEISDVPAKLPELVLNVTLMSY